MDTVMEIDSQNSSGAPELINFLEINSSNVDKTYSDGEPNESESVTGIVNTTCESDCIKNVFEYPSLFPNRTLLELCSSSWSRSPKTKQNVQPYLRGCKWSPDGTCCLSVVNNDGVHVTELPRDLYSGSVTADRTIDVLDSIIHVKEAGLVYDFCWYPGMNSNIPETCCWITTRQNAPIQMWDAFDGSLRCSYRGFNSVDEMEPALSITFSQEGTRIIAGYKKVLRTFDVERPGRDFSEHKITSSASCFATNSNLLAVGSWNTTISLYNISEMGTYKSIGKMHGHSGGVTHAKFTPDGLRLVSGARKDHRLLVWDIRYYRRPLNILSRVVNTNQRVYFDISPCGRYLVSGGTDGILKVWDVEQVDWKSSLDVTDVDIDNVTFKFPIHRDCCNSVSIHPYRPIVATGSGQYHFTDPFTLLDENEPNILNRQMNPEELNSECEQEILQDLRYSQNTENSLVFWWTGSVPDIT
ncbi:telomerase Cajal body protein 1 homolog [Galleria mellonella]|uniref:WD repeat-containing protein 79 n=1 Tax=Galleria mellonella TaxID=7137 RepID=A0ABM3MDU1_GALME|nr:telomerase Cajal body protein 1 homolog [Galleria mellonella]